MRRAVSSTHTSSSHSSQSSSSVEAAVVEVAVGVDEVVVEESVEALLVVLVVLADATGLTVVETAVGVAVGLTEDLTVISAHLPSTRERVRVLTIDRHRPPPRPLPPIQHTAPRPHW